MTLEPLSALGGIVSDHDRYLARQAAANAAVEAIERGEWDCYLLRLRAAIKERRASEEYREFVRGNPVAKDF